LNADCFKQVNANAMEKALTQDMLATDVAEYIVRKGVPFRQAHHIAGRAVHLAETTQRTLSQLTLEEYKSLDAHFDADITSPAWWTFERSVESRDAVGGTNKQRVVEQIDSLEQLISSHQ
jgi:argininosuccinate lyase